ncbi:sensor histidine kinase [Massilia scottii]|uniref:sensor histidine kinase n=1 Tax=Massilia scottii TaxID=3057166 RepID=UPI002796B10E|nr:HAMP domain-containing sensor histidine kinase [Massilia sp. CCM 9029]MDQ1834096.1 HAMP domain-containing sensor histidine kinase [Massilia sp. CCM 9029]
MLHEFLRNNREDLIERCRVKVNARPRRDASPGQLQNGVPMFLDQLIRTLEVEESTRPTESTRISGPAGGAQALSEVSVTAAQHGKDLLELGFSVDQVVHDYGDLCQAITDLAVERDAPFQVDEFRTLNRCLDNVISDAVTEFSYQRDEIFARKLAVESNRRLGFYSDELRNHLGTASLAFAAAKAGNLSLGGATGSILERALISLEKLIDESLDDVRLQSSDPAILDVFSLSKMIQEIVNAADPTASHGTCTLHVQPVDTSLGLVGNRERLLTAVAYILQDAFKFTKPNTEVLLTAYGAADRILIDIRDHCGGLAPGVEETMFLPYSQRGSNRTGSGLGLTIAQQSINANNGILSVRDVPGTGCIFTVSLPRHTLPN